MKRSSLGAAVLVAALLVGPGRIGPSGQTPVAAPGDLTGLFGPRGFVRDSNGDTLADLVAARIIVPALPTIEDSAAAVNLAARLGFETTSLTLPLVQRDDSVSEPAAVEVPIIVGRTNRLVQTLVERKQIDLTPLQPGQGLIAAVPSPLGSGTAVVIVGADDKGTLAAANVVAARLPRLWNMSGVTLSGLGDHVGRYLSSRGIDARAAVRTIVVDSDRRGLAKVGLRAAVTAAAAPRAAARARGSRSPAPSRAGAAGAQLRGDCADERRVVGRRARRRPGRCAALRPQRAHVDAADRSQ